VIEAVGLVEGPRIASRPPYSGKFFSVALIADKRWWDDIQVPLAEQDRQRDFACNPDYFEVEVRIELISEFIGGYV
jgi:hypothetical protein